MIDYEYRAGTLVQDPDLRFTPNTGTTCLTMRLGQSISRFNESSGRWERTKEHYFDVVVWPQRRGETQIDVPTLVHPLLRRGMGVVVRGRFETRKYVNKRGDDVYSTEFVAERVYIDALELAPEEEASGAPAAPGDEEPPWLRGGGF